MQLILKFTLCLCLVSLTMAAQAETLASKVDIFGKTQAIFTSNHFGGAGASVNNLITSYDLSIFEFGLGAKQSSFNGSGVTTNTSYPLTEGDAFTQNTQLGVSSQIFEDLKAGLSAEFYSLAGDRTVGRVFGAELPWDDFGRNDEGSIIPSRFQAGLYNAFIEGKKEDLTYKLVAGNLSPRELPEFTRKEMNQVKLGSLVYRAPITSGSFLEKEERRLLEGRHPLRGFDFLSNYMYDEKKNVHVEIFNGITEPTPVSDIERETYGGRVSLDILEGNVGLTYVATDGQRANGIDEDQDVWSIDSSYKVYEWLVPYLTVAQTDYTRKNTGETHDGSAYVAGVLFKLPQKAEFKVQYQRVDENYDLMAYHKIEHYPSNTQGVNLQAIFPLNDNLKLKGVVYHLQQLDLATTTEDSLFGDSFFPSIANSRKGTIDAQRLGADWKVNDKWSLNGYVEHALFYKEASTTLSSIDKDIYSFYLSSAFVLTPKVNLELGYRHFLSKGDWQAMAFDSFQNVPEVGLHYIFDKDHRAYLIYNYYDFNDEVAASQGNNDYYGHQLILEAKIIF